MAWEIKTNPKLQVNNAGWSSLVARRAHNPKVVGSNPAPATIYQKRVSNTLKLSFIYVNIVGQVCNKVSVLRMTDGAIILGNWLV